MANNNLVDHGKFLLCAANYIIHVIAEDDCQIYYICVLSLYRKMCVKRLRLVWTIRELLHYQHPLPLPKTLRLLHIYIYIYICTPPPLKKFLPEFFFTNHEKQPEDMGSIHPRPPPTLISSVITKKLTVIKMKCANEKESKGKLHLIARNEWTTYATLTK